MHRALCTPRRRGNTDEYHNIITATAVRCISASLRARYSRLAVQTLLPWPVPVTCVVACGSSLGTQQKQHAIIVPSVPKVRGGFGAVRLVPFRPGTEVAVVISPRLKIMTAILLPS